MSRSHSTLSMGANGTCSTPTIILIQQQCRRMVSFEVAQLWRGTRTCTDTSVNILHESADNHIQKIDPNHRKNTPRARSHDVDAEPLSQVMPLKTSTIDTITGGDVASCGFAHPWIDPLPKCSTTRRRELCRSEHWEGFVNVGGDSLGN